MTETFVPPYDSGEEYASIAAKHCTEPYAVLVAPNSCYSLKDNFHIDGYRTCASSQLLSDLEPGFDSFVVEVLGHPRCKVLLDQLGVGNLGTNTHNLQDEEGPFGGSSSGSMASLIKDPTLEFSICSDTGGSARNPVRTRKVFKVLVPAWGQISRRGLIPMSDPLDRVSIMARTFDRLQQVYTRLNRVDPLDGSCIPFQAAGTLPVLWLSDQMRSLLKACSQEITDTYLALTSTYFRSSTDRYGLVYLASHRLNREETERRRSILGPGAKDRLTAVPWSPQVCTLSRDYYDFLYGGEARWMSPDLRRLNKFFKTHLVALQLGEPSAGSPDPEYKLVNLLNLSAVTFKKGEICQLVAPRGYQRAALAAARHLDES